MVDVIQITVQEFRLAMPAFADTTKYPNTQIQAFIERAGYYISTTNCGSLRNGARVYALELMAAHLLTLNDKILSGDTSASGRVTSTSIDKISVSLEAPKSQDDWAYWMELTPYGFILLALLKSKAPIGIYSGGINYRKCFR